MRHKERTNIGKRRISYAQLMGSNSARMLTNYSLFNNVELKDRKQIL